MQVCVIKNTDSRNINIPVAMAVGGAAGLALRQFLPVQKAEIDTFLFNHSDSIKKDSANNAIKQFMLEAKQAAHKNPENKALHFFIRSREAKGQEAKRLKFFIKNLSEEFQGEISQLRSSLANRVRASRQLSLSVIKNATKSSRPVATYLLPGIGLSALGAFVYNVVGTISKN